MEEAGLAGFMKARGKKPDIAEKIKSAARKLEGGSAVGPYMDICGCLDTDRVEGFVYEEFADYLSENEGKAQALSDLVKGKKDFFNQEISQSLFPMARIMLELGEEYHSRIMDLGYVDKYHLATAYSIADRNVNEANGRNYLSNFFALVKGKLDEDPDGVGRWAKDISEGFRSRTPLDSLFHVPVRTDFD